MNRNGSPVVDADNTLERRRAGRWAHQKAKPVSVWPVKFWEEKEWWT